MYLLVNLNLLSILIFKYVPLREENTPSNLDKIKKGLTLNRGSFVVSVPPFGE